MSVNSFFKAHGPFRLSELATAVQSEFIGDGALMIKNVATLSGAKAGDITFLSNPRYTTQLPETKASACIIEKRYMLTAPSNLALIVNDNPYAVYAQIASMFHPLPTFSADIATNCYVSKSAKIGKNCRIETGAYIEEGVVLGDNCYIGANTYIGPRVQIGQNTHIYPNVSIICATVGENCLIHSGARVGQDGFGFAPSKVGIIKVPQIGGVQVGNNVEIGANTCIDRGALEDTVIGNGTKIDNLVQIGHGAQIGKNCIIAGQGAVAGSTVIEDGVMMGGQVGVAGHLRVGAGAMIAAQSGVMQDVPAKTVVGGTPADDIRKWHRQTAILRRMVRKKLNEQHDG